MASPHPLRRALVLALVGGTVACVRSARAAPREIRVVARKFVWEPNVITLKLGEPVTLRLSAPEVPMGFSLPDFGVRADIVPGQESMLQLTPDKVGSFTFVCDVFCGNGHEDMAGTVVVHA
jgi:cytochrome c oxidase subunit 2